MTDPLEEKRAELKRKAELHQQKLERAVQNLKEAAQRSVAIGPTIAQHPWHWMAGALAVGLWLGLRQH
jgi:ElaB/YqjD/DUF883 family membrane-anchored ribosome-binding protein